MNATKSANRAKPKTATMTDQQVSRIFSAHGRAHGFTDVTAEFAPLRDFKVKWIRNYSWASFTVCDYVNDMDADTMNDLAETVFQRICGSMTPYPESVRDYIARPDFIKAHRATYLDRFDGCIKSTHGEYHDLKDSLDRLVQMGLLSQGYADTVVLSWGPVGMDNAVGMPSIVFRTAVVSRDLDKDYVDEDLLDYAVWTMLAKVQMGVNAGTAPRYDEYLSLLEQFPDKDRHDSELRLLQLHY